MKYQTDWIFIVGTEPEFSGVFLLFAYLLCSSDPYSICIYIVAEKKQYICFTELLLRNFIHPNIQNF